MRVHLDWAEVRVGCHLGVERQLRAYHLGRVPRAGQDWETTWGANIQGALGEVVVARVLNLYPVMTGHTDRGDVGQGAVEVRATPHPDGGLLVRRGDLPDAPYVLVTGAPPDFRVVGWMRGAEAMSPQWLRVGLRGRPPCYIVPQGALHPIQELAL